MAEQVYQIVLDCVGEPNTMAKDCTYFVQL